MTAQEITSAIAAKLGLDADGFRGPTESFSELLEYANYALRTIGRMVSPYQMNISLTVSAGTVQIGMGSTSIGKRMKTVRNLGYGNNTLKNFIGKPGPYNSDEFNVAFPSWRNAAVGVTTAYTFDGTNIYVTPPPTTGISTLSWWVEGEYIPADLVNTTDEPDLPEDLHEAIVDLGYIYAAHPGVSEEHQLARFGEMFKQSVLLIEKVRQQQEANRA